MTWLLYLVNSLLKCSIQSQITVSEFLPVSDDPTEQYRAWSPSLNENRDIETDDESIFGPTGQMILYHFSPNRFNNFLPFSHVGTIAAAKQRARDLRTSGYLYKISMTIQKSVKVIDTGFFNHESRGIMEYLETIIGLEFDEIDEVSRNPSASAKLLEKYGIDALWYKNSHEDSGSISFIILNPTKTKIMEISRL